jgi:hypothetical protein
MGRRERIQIEAAPKLFDVVELLDALPAAGLEAGALGAIVEQLAPDTFIVEFVSEDGVTLSLETLASDEFAVRQ